MEKQIENKLEKLYKEMLDKKDFTFNDLGNLFFKYGIEKDLGKEKFKKMIIKIGEYLSKKYI